MERIEYFGTPFTPEQLKWLRMHDQECVEDIHRLTDEVEGLTLALNSRTTIGNAVGLVMAGGHALPDEAFNVLIRASQRENRKLAEIAAEMVASHVERVGQERAAAGPTN